MKVYVGLWCPQYEGEAIETIASTPQGAMGERVTAIEVWDLDGEWERTIRGAEFAAIATAWRVARVEP